MARADRAEVSWGGPERKKGWTVRLYVGAEVIKRRPEKGPAADAGDDAVRTMAVTAAADEGYELDPAQVTIAGR